jgi:hypothetical protein
MLALLKVTRGIVAHVALSTAVQGPWFWHLPVPVSSQGSVIMAERWAAMAEPQEKSTHKQLQEPSNYSSVTGTTAMAMAVFLFVASLSLHLLLLLYNVFVETKPSLVRFR